MVLVFYISSNRWQIDANVSGGSLHCRTSSVVAFQSISSQKCVSTAVIGLYQSENNQESGKDISIYQTGNLIRDLGHKELRSQMWGDEVTQSLGGGHGHL